MLGPRDRSHGWVGERCDEMAERATFKQRVGVTERDDLSAGVRHCSSDCGQLAQLAGQFDNGESGLTGRAGRFSRSVGATVADNDAGDPLRPVVHCKDVADFGADQRFLVVGGDDDCD